MALTGLLSGIASGAGEVYGNIAEEKRKNTMRQNELLADTISNRLNTDDTLTDEDALNLHAQELKLRGVPDKDAQQILQVSKYHHNLLKSQQAQMNNPGGAEGPPGTAGSPAQTVTPPAVHVPGQDPNHPDQGPSTQIPGTEAGPGLPPMPQYQPPTQGDYKSQLAVRSAQAMAPVKVGAANAEQQGKMAALSAKDKQEIQDKIQAATDAGAPMSPAQVDNLIAGIKTPAMVSAKGSKPISGAQITQNEPNATDVHGGPIPNDPAAMYSQLLNRDGTPAGYVRFSPPSSGKEWIRVPVNESSTGWAHETFDQYGNHAGYRMNVMPPASLLPQLKTDVINHIVEQSDGSRVAVPLPNTTTRGPALPAPISVAPGQASSPAQGGGIDDRVIPATAGPSAPLPNAPGSPQPQGPAPGMPAKPPAMPVRAGAGPAAALPRVVGGRSLTPEQSIKQSQALPMVNLAISKLKFLEANADIFGNAISSGKIALQTDPHQGFIKAVLNKGMTLSPLEADIAATFTKASEEIFLTKNVMGAGSMPRSGEAMDVIEAQKGLVGQSPEVIKRLLHQTLQEFQATHGALATASKKYGFGTDADRVEAPIASAYGTHLNVGDVRGNFKYKGGDPSQQSSWEPK